MTARLIDGTALARKLRVGIADRVAALAVQGVVPGLAVILVGDDPAAQSMSGARSRPARRSGSAALPSVTRQRSTTTPCWRASPN
jgi:methylenetetrahydrofolate dehydrogenase (NADP+)/methenyltetrahydrofolate cyclohydrolase